MSAVAALRLVLNALDDAGVPYMLVGSFASTLRGAPHFDRRVETELFGMRVWTATAEDTVLAKLDAIPRPVPPVPGQLT